MSGKTNCVGLLGKSSPSSLAFTLVGLSGIPITLVSTISSPSRRAFTLVGLSRGLHTSPRPPSMGLGRSSGGGGISLRFIKCCTFFIALCLHCLSAILCVINCRHTLLVCSSSAVSSVPHQGYITFE